MSFMKGFGAAFSESFDREQRIKAQERDDQFKMTYQEFIKKREARDEQAKSDTKLANQAKALIEGVDGVPPEAYGKVYNWLQSGLDDQEISRRLQSGKFTVKQKAGEKEVQETPNAKPVDEQMDGGGLGAPAGAEPTPPQEDTGFLGKISGGLNKATGGLLGSSRESNQNSAYDKIAGATGMSRDEVSNTIGSSITPKAVDDSNVSFTPGEPERKPDPFAQGNEAAIDLAEAKASGDPQWIAKAQRRMDAIKAYDTSQARAKADADRGGLGGTAVTTWRMGPDGQPEYATNRIVKIVQDPNGKDQAVDAITGEPIQEQWRPITKYEDDMIKQAASDLKEPLQKLNSKAANAQALVKAYSISADLVRKSGGKVLAQKTGWASQTLSKFAQELGAAASEFNRIAGEGGVMTDEAMADLKILEDKVNSEGIDDFATQSALWELQNSIIAYRLGAAMGQENKSLAEGERKMFQEMGSNQTSAEKYYNGMSNLIVPIVKSIDVEGDRLVRSDTNVRSLDYVPKQLEFQKIEDDLDNSDDPDVKNAWKELKGLSGIKEDTPKSNLNPAEKPPVVITNDAAGKAAFDALQPGERFIAPNGSPRRKGRGPINE